MRAILLNHHRLNWDNALDLSALEREIDLSIREETSPDEIVDAARGFDVLITKEVQVPAATLRELGKSSVRLICEAGTGYNNIDLSAAADAGIRVCNVPQYSTAAVAQLTMSFLLGVASRTKSYSERQARGDRSDFAGAPESPVELEGKTLGVVGAGDIGSRVVAHARAFGMRVLTFNRKPRTWSLEEVHSVPLHELLERSDFITLHCPLVELGPDATRHLIASETLSLMKPTAWLINTARGGFVNEIDLIAALREGRIAGACLDVQDPEPPGAQSPLWDLAQITPHAGWKALEARQRLMDRIASNIKGFRDGNLLNEVSS